MKFCTSIWALGTDQEASGPCLLLVFLVAQRPQGVQFTAQLRDVLKYVALYALPDVIVQVLPAVVRGHLDQVSLALGESDAPCSALAPKRLFPADPLPLPWSGGSAVSRRSPVEAGCLLGPMGIVVIVRLLMRA